MQSLETLSDDFQTNWIVEATLVVRTGSVVTLTAPKTNPSKFLRIAISDVDSTGDGLNDWEKYQLGLDPFNAYSNGHVDANGQPLDDYTYVATYILGSVSNYVTISATGLSVTQPEPGQPATQTATFTISRSGPSSGALQVNLGVTGPGMGIANEGLDYVALPPSVIIPAGANSQTITLIPLADTNLLTFEYWPRWNCCPGPVTKS